MITPSNNTPPPRPMGHVKVEKFIQILHAVNKIKLTFSANKFRNRNSK